MYSEATAQLTYKYRSSGIHFDVLQTSLLQSVQVYCGITYSLSNVHIYRPPTKLEKGNVFSRVCLSLQRGGDPCTEPQPPLPTRSNLFTMKHGLSETTEMSSCFNSPSECENYFDNKNAFQQDAYRSLQWPSSVGGGGVCPRGVCQGACTPPWTKTQTPPIACWDTHPPPVNRMTDRGKNITFPQLRLQAVKILRTNFIYLLL